MSSPPVTTKNLTLTITITITRTPALTLTLTPTLPLTSKRIWGNLRLVYRARRSPNARTPLMPEPPQCIMRREPGAPPNLGRSWVRIPEESFLKIIDLTVAPTLSLTLKVLLPLTQTLTYLPIPTVSTPPCGYLHTADSPSISSKCQPHPQLQCCFASSTWYRMIHAIYMMHQSVKHSLGHRKRH